MSRTSGKKLKIGITLGDVNGIGPELLIRAFMDHRLKELCIPIVYGSSRVINIYRKVLRVNKFHYVIIQNPNQAQARKLNLIECQPGLERIEIGKPSEQGGKAAAQAVKRAIEDAQHQALDGLITLPVDKSTFQLSEPGFAGHTELLAKAFNVPDNLMMMVWENIRIGVVTNHVPVAEISQNISTERIIRKAEIMHKSLIHDFNIQQPMIAILGLNPHAGDNGLVGNEEAEIIQPAIQELKRKNIRAMGPYPADGFFGGMKHHRFDGILAMYHDQGLIPFKLMAGYEGVNYTAGIPLVRTSPDHGVAYDIAGKNTATAESLRQSLFLTLDIIRNKTTNDALAENALEPINVKNIRPPMTRETEQTAIKEKEALEELEKKSIEEN